MDEAGKVRWWLWPSALSLEAPAVALAWQDLLARSHGTILRPEGRAALGLAVWAVYLADRLIDIRSHKSGDERTTHGFCRGHRRLVLMLLTGIVAADSLLALFWLRPEVRINGIYLAICVGAYLFFFVWLRSFRKWKALSTALLFTSGVFLIAWSRTPWLAHALLIQAFVFFTLCLGNLLLSRSARLVGFCMTALALCCAVPTGGAWYAAAGAGAAGLAAVAAFGRELSMDVRGLLADAVLLIPALRVWTSIG